jgi:hypothetical protein
LEILSFFYKGISGKEEFQSLDEFGKNIYESEDTEIASRFQEIKNSRSAENFLDFADFILNKSVAEIKK